MTKPVNIGMIGYGFMGKAHSNAWAKAHRIFDLPARARLRAIAAVDPTALEPFAAKWGWETWTTRWQDLVDDPEVDLIDIGSPNDVHAEQAIAALEAGKHVACEKPLAASLAGARAMARAAAATEARQVLREDFVKADVGIIGANALIAESGSLGFLLRFAHRLVLLTEWFARGCAS